MVHIYCSISSKIDFLNELGCLLSLFVYGDGHLFICNSLNLAAQFFDLFCLGFMSRIISKTVENIYLYLHILLFN